MNVFKNLHLSPLFLSIVVFTLAAQYTIIEFGGGLVRTVGLTNDQWIKCILLSSLTLPIGGLMRLVPIDDSETDYAETSKLITTTSIDNDHKGKRDESTRKVQSQQWDVSFLLWLVVVTVIPVLVLQQFNDHWKLFL